MDWTSMLAGGPFAGLLTPPGSPTSSDPNAPMNITPQVAQTSPTQPAAQPGILNQQQGGNDAIAQALKMIQQPTPQVQSAAPPIQMAKPAGSAAGFNPATILAAMRGQPVTV